MRQKGNELGPLRQRKGGDQNRQPTIEGRDREKKDIESRLDYLVKKKRKGKKKKGTLPVVLKKKKDHMLNSKFREEIRGLLHPVHAAERREGREQRRDQARPLSRRRPQAERCEAVSELSPKEEERGGRTRFLRKLNALTKKKRGQYGQPPLPAHPISAVNLAPRFRKEERSRPLGKEPGPLSRP